MSSADVDAPSASIFIPKLEGSSSTPKSIFEVQRARKRRLRALKRSQDAAQNARNIGCL